MSVAATLPAPADFPAWRLAARGMLAAGIPPEQAEFRLAGEAPGLFASEAAPPPAPATHRISRAFLEQADIAIRHSDSGRFALLYGLLWRLTHGEPRLLQCATDPGVIRLAQLVKAVRRDAHKMHAFLRFRQVETEAGPRHLAWFEPDHHIEEAEAGFFVRRFAALRWSIVTPRRTVTWDGEDLAFGPGGHLADLPPDDAMEPLWRAYYVAICNPARLKPAAMRAEMPRKYWHNLPETREIPRLMAEAEARVAAMRAGTPNPLPQKPRHLATHATPHPMLDHPALPDFAHRATQPVWGEGPPGAALLLVGEQPGEEEDLGGRPFIGPAGQILDRALAEAGVDRAASYLTNAVKHFKFEVTGQRRLHKSPDPGDIVFYRPFLLREVSEIAPRLVVALGASALFALTGQKLPVLKTRGQVVPGLTGQPVFATIHPSYLLRLPGVAAQRAAFSAFVADLRAARVQADA